MSQIPPEVAAAIGRLTTTDDYSLVVRWLGQQFDSEMRRLINVEADNNAFVQIGLTRAFNYVLQVLSTGKVQNG